MSSEGFVVTNPRGNNRDVVVFFDKRDGTRKKLKTLRPGETFTCEKSLVVIEEVKRPPRLLLTADGEFVKDSKGRTGRPFAES